MSKTPRTDTVHKAAMSLPWGSCVVVPEGHPPTCPWELARQLEREVQEHKRNQDELWVTVNEISELIQTMREKLL